ncbi:TCP-1/cpn60 chaperonin family protein [Halomontanus rarus]|uniref:TCP-1/cpn60 chaperonin family protein n=1 Tax=Halomontanus rarus TaxID=3034020 RepID=UPI001A981B49
MGTIETNPTDWDQLSAEETRAMIRRAAGEMGELVRTTLGPFGRDKMVVRRMQDDTIRSFVSNDGIAILEEFEGETSHPVADQFIRLAEDHEDEYGDGSTAAVVYASELLQTGMDLIDRGVPPVDVIEGFSIGAQRTLEVWTDRSLPLTSAARPTAPADFDADRMRSVAWSGMTNGRTGDWPLEGVVDDVLEATYRAWEPARGSVDLSYVRTEAIPGGDSATTELLPGVLLPAEPMRAEYLLPVDGDVLLIHGDLKPRGVRSNSLSMSVDDAAVVEQLERETELIADSIAVSGASAVFVTGDVTHDLAVELARHDVLTFRNVKRNHLEYLSRVTGARIRGTVSSGEPATAAEVGRATVRTMAAQGEKTWLAVTAPDGADPGCVQLVVRGGTESVAEEAERRIKGGLNATRAAIKRPEALVGGGAADLEAAAAVRELAPRFDGREQLAVEEFADVLESIPRTLARNAGHDPIDAMVDLRTRHDAGLERAGIDAAGDIVDDTVDSGGALDAFVVRTSGLVRSLEFANSLLTIDSVLIDHRPAIDPEDMPWS